MKQVLGWCGVLLLASCVDNAGSSLEIVSSPVPEEGTCTFRPDLDTSISAGLYDVIGGGAISTTPGFVFGVRMFNNLAERDDDSSQGVRQNVNINPQANNINIVGFETCFFREDATSINAKANLEGNIPPAFDCDNLPDQVPLAGSTTPISLNEAQLAQQRIFAPGAGTVPEGQFGVSSFSVLTPLHLQAAGIFGPNFNMGLLTQIGIMNNDTNRDGDFTDASDFVYNPNYVDNLTIPATVPTRDPTNLAARNPLFGNWPASFTARLIVITRAVGRRNAGDIVVSNWFTFPIDLCMGCIVDDCGVRTPVFCENEANTSCGPNNPAVTGDTVYPQLCHATPVTGTVGTCDGNAPVPGAPCAPLAIEYTGEIANFAGLCLPFQDISEVVCDPLPNACAEAEAFIVP